MIKKRKKKNININKIVKILFTILILFAVFMLTFSLINRDSPSSNVDKIINNSSEVINSENSFELDENISSSENTTGEVSSSESEFVSSYHFTLVGTMNEWDVANNDYLFSTNDDIVFNLNVDLSIGDEFKIVNDNAWEWQYNVNNVIDDSKEFIDTSSSDNIKMITEGNFEIELNIVEHTIQFTRS